MRLWCRFCTVACGRRWWARKRVPIENALRSAKLVSSLSKKTPDIRYKRQRAGREFKPYLMPIFSKKLKPIKTSMLACFRTRRENGAVLGPWHRNHSSTQGGLEQQLLPEGFAARIFRGHPPKVWCLTLNLDISHLDGWQPDVTSKVDQPRHANQFLSFGLHIGHSHLNVPVSLCFKMPSHHHAQMIIVWKLATQQECQS